MVDKDVRVVRCWEGDVAMVVLRETEKSWGRMDLMFLKDMVRFSLGIGVGRWISKTMAR